MNSFIVEFWSRIYGALRAVSLFALVRRTLALVIDRNLQANADRYGAPQYGSHLERYLVDALRHLACTHPGWLVNREKSRVWYGPDGLFLVWPSAAQDIQTLLDAAQLPGIPKAPTTIMEVLLQAGAFESTPAGQATWLIQPPGTKVKIEAIKLSSVAILFAGLTPAPLPLAQGLTAAPENSEHIPSPAPCPQAAPAPGTQLSLIPSREWGEQLAPPIAPEPSPNPARSPIASHAESTPEPCPRTIERTPIALQAPLRLNPVVRDALNEVVNTLNTGTGPAQCCTVALGVFVPLHEFERRGIQPSMALRALSDVHMLVRDQGRGPPTTARDFNGTPTVGLTIAPRFIGGVDLDAFASPETVGG